jgi:ribose-phosphate pyrophosphokinase
VNENIKIFAGSSSQVFAEKMCAYLDVPLGKSDTFKFSDGNIFVRANESVRQKDIFLVQSIGLSPNDDFTEILFWIDAFKRASAHSVTAIIPYFGYAKGDKKDEPRVSIRARVCAECLEVAGVDRVVTVDLHSPQIQGFFKKPVDNLFAMPLLASYIEKLELKDFVVASPDSGGVKRARALADLLSTRVVIGDKSRYAHDEKAEILELIGDVDGRDVVIIDDFSISGGTLVELSLALKAKGAQKIIACLSHVVLTEKGVATICNSPIDLVVSTDSINNPYIAGHSKFVTLSLAPLIAETISRINNGESVSPLFNRIPPKVFDHSLK